MSVAKLSGTDQTRAHTVCDDLESSLWVFLYMLLRHSPLPVRKEVDGPELLKIRIKQLFEEYTPLYAMSPAIGGNAKWVFLVDAPRLGETGWPKDLTSSIPEPCRSLLLDLVRYFQPIIFPVERLTPTEKQVVLALATNPATAYDSFKACFSAALTQGVWVEDGSDQSVGQDEYSRLPEASRKRKRKQRARRPGVDDTEVEDVREDEDVVGDGRQPEGSDTDDCDPPSSPARMKKRSRTRVAAVVTRFEATPAAREKEAATSGVPVAVLIPRYERPVPEIRAQASMAGRHARLLSDHDAGSRVLD
ncbi:hypothetical protein K488DRAFT_88456 [Vararia minispora EC-137]|uniref:Uncharacterized protein n=1 Tax=Vararia minispora EC-137 TaxID=1314806 RepID=A0ACB8QDP3_9AGAM|nr:hypothetical protein K488DRAFT_88456 [Vararia minispora EC-137]